VFNFIKESGIYSCVICAKHYFQVFHIHYALNSNNHASMKKDTFVLSFKEQCYSKCGP
jgi:hypothetical protein